MAYATAPITSRFDLAARLRAFVADMGEAVSRYRLYRETYNGLMELSDHELDDLGLSRAQLARIAWETSHPE